MQGITVGNTTYYPLPTKPWPGYWTPQSGLSPLQWVTLYGADDEDAGQQVILPDGQSITVAGVSGSPVIDLQPTAPPISDAPTSGHVPPSMQ